MTTALLSPALLPAGVPDLTAVMEAAAPGQKLRGTIISVETVNGQTTFPNGIIKNEPDATDFWPASTIKLYTAIAALEKLHALHLPVETTLTFERRETTGPWILDCARSMPKCSAKSGVVPPTKTTPSSCASLVLMPSTPPS